MNLPAVLLVLFGSPFTAPAFPGLTSPPPANLTGAYLAGDWVSDGDDWHKTAEWVLLLVKVGPDKYTCDWIRESDGMRCYMGTAVQQGDRLILYWRPLVEGWEAGGWEYRWDGEGYEYGMGTHFRARFEVRPR